MATTPRKADGTTDGELLMATGGLAGALTLVALKTMEDDGSSVIGRVTAEMDGDSATNVFNVEMYGAPFKVTVEHG